MNDIHKRPTKSTVAVAYLRTATAERVGSRLGLERQRQTCEQHAHALGLRLGAVYADVGVSGLSEDRPALAQLMLDVASGRIGHVIVAGPDRLARDRELEQRIGDRIRSQGSSLAMPCDSRQPTSAKEEI